MGKAFHDETQSRLSNSSNWADYWLPKPRDRSRRTNVSYVTAVKADGVALVGAGIYRPDPTVFERTTSARVRLRSRAGG